MGIAEHARVKPDAVAIVSGDERITFAELDRRANRAAHVLRDAGAGPGSPVAISLGNRAEQFEVLVGAARIGAAVVPVSWRFKRDEVRYMVQDSAAAVVIAEEDARDVTHGMPAIHLGGAFERLVAAAPDRPVEGSLEPAPVLVRYYTSGTTGYPKAVERARADTESYLRSVRQQLEIYGVAGSDDVHLVAGPLYHSGPLGLALYALTLGQKLVLMPRFDAETFLRLVQAESVTWSFMVPIHFSRILALPDDIRRRYDLSSFRRAIHAGAPCPPEIKRRIMEVLPPGSVWEFYGMTEGRATIISPDEWLRKPGSVGRAIPGVELKIMDREGAELPPYAVGLVYICLPGRARFRYAGAPEKTDAAWRGDFYTVGDMGYLDDEGYLFLTDREQDLIISGGSNVYPAEVEAVVHMHPAVADVAVIGVPDDEWGERVHAIVQARAPLDADDLIAFCRERLAHYKCPRSVDLVDELPRDPNGKVRKRELRDVAWRGRERAI